MIKINKQNVSFILLASIFLVFFVFVSGCNQKADAQFEGNIKIKVFSGIDVAYGTLEDLNKEMSPKHYRDYSAQYFQDSRSEVLYFCKFDFTHGSIGYSLSPLYDTNKKTGEALIVNSEDKIKEYFSSEK